MRSTLAPTRHDKAIRFYFLYIALITIAYALLVLTHMAREWLLSEWLINYQGGFIRRGLPGQVAYALSRLTHLSPVVYIVFLCLSLYALLFGCLLSLANRSTKSYWVIALLISPATLSFQILDVLAGFHKELIYLAALALFVVLLRERRLSPFAVTAYLTVAILLTTLSHEPLVCYVPFFFAALMLAGRSFAEALRQCVFPFALGVGVAYLCARHLGDSAIAARICSSLGYTFAPDVSVNQVCSGGAIAYLRTTPAAALDQVRFKIQHYHYLSVYSGLTLLALAPALVGSFSLLRRGFSREIRVLWSMAALAFAGSFVLFMYGADWGRWIYIHIFSITILLLFVDGRASEFSSSQATTAPPSRRTKLAAWVLLLLYSTVWTLPHFNENAPHFGYISLADFLLSLPGRYAHK